MTTPEIIFNALTILAPILSVLIAIFAYSRNRKNDSRQNSEEWGAIKSDLKYIKSGIDDLKTSDKEKDKRLETLTNHISVLEEKVDSHIKNTSIHYSRKGGSK